MNKIERITMIKAMEYIIRNCNDEEDIMAWLEHGVADGDIAYGSLAPLPGDEDDLEYYIEDDAFADLMQVFLDILHNAAHDGGLYCDGILSGG